MKQPNKAQKTRKADSKEKVDCHATAAAAARNDRKTAPSKKQILATTPHSHCETSAGSRGNPKKVDSRSNKTAEVLQSSNSQNATRRQDFGDKNGALQGESRAHTRAYVTADSPQQSPFLAQKPTPKPSPIRQRKTNLHQHRHSHLPSQPLQRRSLHPTPHSQCDARPPPPRAF